jgi:hypothetical protein
MTMVLKQIKDRWFMLTSDDGETKLTWFGQTKGEVMGKFRSYIRNLDLDRVRYQPRSNVPKKPDTGVWVD